MHAAALLRRARLEAGLTLRALAERAGTSHATLAAYESGSKIPRASTVDRIVRAAGFALDGSLAKRIDGPDRASRGQELADVLELAAQFPARHSKRLKYPIFGQ